jgi:hypothetical protein
LLGEGSITDEFKGTIGGSGAEVEVWVDIE